MEKKRGEGGCRVASEKIMEDSLVIKKKRDEDGSADANHNKIVLQN